MLKIRGDVLANIKQTFASSSQEQGFILGCMSCIEQLEYCIRIPAVQSGIYYYIPDTHEADRIIKLWASQGICFCGFIHSHVINKKQLSENDIEFAKKLFSSYKLPVLWFGLGVFDGAQCEIFFYSVTQKNNLDIVILPVLYKGYDRMENAEK